LLHGEGDFSIFCRPVSLFAVIFEKNKAFFLSCDYYTPGAWEMSVKVCQTAEFAKNKRYLYCFLYWLGDILKVDKKILLKPQTSVYPTDSAIFIITAF
jgi:hypothetical protein